MMVAQSCQEECVRFGGDERAGVGLPAGIDQMYPRSASLPVISIARIDDSQIARGVEEHTPRQRNWADRGHGVIGAIASARYSYFLLESVGGASIAEPTSL